MPFSILTDRAVLAVSGADAREFLQGLISNDIRKVTPVQAIFAALLTPQGRFLFDFFIIEHEGKLLIETDKARLPELKKRLMMYRLRSKVEFEEISLTVAAAWGEAQGTKYEALVTYHDPRLPELGIRMIMDSSSRRRPGPQEIPAFAGMTPDNDYDAHRLSLAVPEGAKDLVADRSLLLEYGYDELNGVDFAKGCYVGQEVTARSKHRATLRKFIHAAQADSPLPLPPPGTPVLAGGAEIGVMASAKGNIGLAHLRVEAAAKGGLISGGIAITAGLPQWCKTSFTT